MIRPEILDAMVASGCTAEQIAAVVKAAMANGSTNADRQRRYRERHRNARNVTERNGDVTVTPIVTPPSPPKERSPTPPKEITPSPSDTHTESASELETLHPVEIKRAISKAEAARREKRRRDENLIAWTADFEVWWPSYPERKAKPAALKAYLAARAKGATAEEIDEGCKRYVAEGDRDPTMRWAHGATWLNAERWGDEYRPRAPPGSGPPPAPRRQSGSSQMFNSVRPDRPHQPTGNTIDAEATRLWRPDGAPPHPGSDRR